MFRCIEQKTVDQYFLLSFELNSCSSAFNCFLFENGIRNKSIKLVFVMESSDIVSINIISHVILIPNSRTTPEITADGILRK